MDNPEELGFVTWGVHGYHRGPFDLSLVISKAGIVLQVSVTCKRFLDIPDALICLGENIFVIVEGRRSHRGTGHLSRVCLGQNLALQVRQTTLKEAVGIEKSEKIDKADNGFSER